MSRRLIVASQFRINPTDSTSNFTVSIPNYINVSKLKLVEATIPLTYFVINSTNNTFQVSVQGFSTYTITLTPGTYISSTVITEIQNQMNASIPIDTYIVSLNPISNLINIIAATYQFKILTTAVISNPLSIGRILGFGTVAPGFAINYTAPNQLNLSGPNELYITSNIITGTLEEVYISATNIPPVVSIIERIPVFQSQGTIQTYIVPPGTRQVYVQSSTFNTLDIQIRYPNGAIADLNNIDVTLIFDI
jgi:hypothetical protein